MTIPLRTIAVFCSVSAAVAVVEPVLIDAQVQVGARIGGRGRGRGGPAGLRLEVKPSETEVYVNGAYAGRVDDFDNIFQRLNARGGEHRITLFLAGHRSFERTIFFQTGRTLVVRHTMERLEPGEPEPERPSSTPAGRRGRGAGRGRGAAASTTRSGSLALSVQPEGATVTIDGEQVGVAGTSALDVHLAAGRHVVEIYKEGYRRLTTEVSIRPEEATPLDITLTPAK
jgi:hypothetical protein